jgi:signal peptidase I
MDFRWLRQSAELSALFVIIVILLRGFVLEGYLISTGSMAPNLLGFHKRIVCPTCGNLFAFGVTFDDSVDPAIGRSSGDSGIRSYATCPNCGQVNINVSSVPNAHGDQLLVQKHLYAFRRPYRWEIVVFRSPHSPGEAFVKRVVGLPGDRLLIRDGDLFVNGQRRLRSLEVQRAMRLLVSDFHHLADDANWEMSWNADRGWVQSGDTLETTSAAPESEPSWIGFRHWRWNGGDHYVETPLSAAHAQHTMLDIRAQFQNLPVSIVDRIEYDDTREVLRCRGVMPEELQRLLLSRSTDDTFRSAVFRLAALSHLAPVTDQYGYNSMVMAAEHQVHDLLLEATLSWSELPGAVTVEVPVENQTFQIRLDMVSSTATLTSRDEPALRKSGRFSLSKLTSRLGDESRSGLTIEVSNFDRQVLVAVNGDTCLTHLVARPDTDRDSPQPAKGDTDFPVPPSLSEIARRTALLVEQQQRWRLGVEGEAVRLEALRMYRDVYYTPGREVNAVHSEYEVPPDCYFVQGDNSPVSSDSRNWRQPAVPHEMLLGKPFFVHLPSYPATLSVGERRIPIRIPDLSRIRYIR